MCKKKELGDSPWVSFSLDFIIICRYCTVSAFHVNKILRTNTLVWAFYFSLYSITRISLAYIWWMFKLLLFTLIVLFASRCFQGETRFKDTPTENDDWKLALEKGRDQHRSRSGQPFVSPSAVLSRRLWLFFKFLPFIWLPMCPV